MLLSGKYTELFSDFRQNTTLHGCRLLCESRRSKLEKIYWWLVYLGMSSFMLYYLINLVNDFTVEPVITTLETTEYSVKNIPYPGIAVCDLNKINKRNVNELVKKLVERSGQSEAEISKKIILLGKLYDHDMTDGESFIEFQKFLDTYDKDERTGSFNIYETMNKLSTPCQEFIKECYFEGIERNCSVIFELHRTMEGFCCILQSLMPANFGKHSPTYPNISKESELTKRGLSFNIDINLDEYSYSIISSVGAKILFYNSKDYPDAASGNLLERLVPGGTEAIIRLDAIKVYTAPELKIFSVKKRNCYFEHEKLTVYGRYSFSDCILDCKLRSIQALCQCIPFYYRLPNISENSEIVNYPVCTLADISCLDSFRGKWSRLYPIGLEDSYDLKLEKQDSLDCSHCVPACDEITYFATAEYSQFRDNAYENISRVHIFFEKPNVALFKQAAMYGWYDMLAYFGGICGLFIGLSLMTVMEILYFLIRFSIVFVKHVIHVMQQN